MMAAQRQRRTSLSVLRRLSSATLDEERVSPADGETNSTQLSDFVKCVNKEACASQGCSFSNGKNKFFRPRKVWNKIFSGLLLPQHFFSTQLDL